MQVNPACLQLEKYKRYLLFKTIVAVYYHVTG